MKVKEHYDNHLADFYSWMVGDFDQKRTDFQNFLENNGIYPSDTKVAIDLGAGHGIQSVALKKLGFSVIAIDFNDQLLNELKSNPNGQSIKAVKTDIRNINNYSELKPELIICCGDTITHLENKSDIKKLIENCANILNEKGKLILSYRDYTIELNDQQRFIPVKSDRDRILTCILDYEPEKVKVTDLLYEKIGNEWKHKVSSYKKVRISPNEIDEIIENSGLKITFNESIDRMQTMIAEKKNGSKRKIKHGLFITMKYFENINNLNEYFNIDSKHSLIDIRKYSDIMPLIPMKTEPVIFGFYKISFVKNFNGFMQLGKTKFNGTNGILYFVEPGQKYSCTSTEPWDGYQILVHPDIYKNTLRGKMLTLWS